MLLLAGSPDLRRVVAPPGRHPWPWATGSSSRLASAWSVAAGAHFAYIFYFIRACKFAISDVVIPSAFISLNFYKRKNFPLTI